MLDRGKGLANWEQRVDQIGRDEQRLCFRVIQNVRQALALERDIDRNRVGAELLGGGMTLSVKLSGAGLRMR